MRTQHFSDGDVARHSFFSVVGVGPGTVGPGTVGPGTVGPGTVGPGTVGPGTVGPGTVGPGTVGPGTVGPGTGSSAKSNELCCRVLRLQFYDQFPDVLHLGKRKLPY